MNSRANIITPAMEAVNKWQPSCLTCRHREQTDERFRARCLHPDNPVQYYCDAERTRLNGKACGAAGKRWEPLSAIKCTSCKWSRTPQGSYMRCHNPRASYLRAQEERGPLGTCGLTASLYVALPKSLGQNLADGIAEVGQCR